ncbi:hypothetical protein BsWGS_08678 [Bradybaena similaris]
MQVNSQL